MTTLRQAAEMALEAWDDPQGMPKLCKALDKLREALAQPEQEPAGVVVAAVKAISDAAMIKWTSDYRPKVGDLIYTTPAPIPEGWQLVPIEPTEEMINAADKHEHRFSDIIYCAMLAAAPKPEEMK